MRMRGVAMAAAMFFACGLVYAGEDTDFGIAPTRALRLTDHAAPTPREVPGARTIRTDQLKAWLKRDARERPLLVDVVGGDGHDSLPGAVWLPGAGRGQALDDPVQARLAKALRALTQDDRRKPMVFFCAGTQCWLSYNAALRAVALGYQAVYWYRGGIEAWIDADGDLAPAQQP